MLFTIVSILVVLLGVLASIVLFFIGVVRGLTKKGWRWVGYSILLFIAIVIFYSGAQFIYLKYFRASTVNNLQQLSQPRPLNSDGTVNFNTTITP